MRLKPTLVLLALVALLGGYAYLFEYRRSDPAEHEKEAFAFNPDAVRRLTLASGASRIAFERDASGTWRITEPMRLKALPRAMEEFLGALAHLEIRRSLPGSRPGPAFGLSPAEASVDFSTDRGRQALLLGSDTPDGQTAYASRAGRTEVLLVSKDFADSVRKGLNDYRDKALAEAPPGGIERIRLTYPDRRLVLERTGGAWKVVEPFKARAGAEETSRMLDGLLSTRADTFVSDDAKDPAPYGLDRPRLTVELVPAGGGEPSGFSIGAALPKKPFERGEGFYARPLGTSSVVTVRLQRIDDYVKEIRHVRPRRILGDAWDAAKRVSIEGSSGTLTADRSAQDRWEAAEPHRGLMDPGPWNRMVSLPLQGLEASAMEPVDPARLSSLGFDRPMGRITVEWKGGSRQVLTLGGVDERTQEAYLTASDEDLLFTVPVSAREILKRTYLELRDPILFPLPISAIRRIEIGRPDATLAFESPAKGVWNQILPERRTGPFAGVGALAAGIAELRAARWLAFGPVDWKAYGLEPPAATIRVVTRDGNEPEKTWTMELGRTDPGSTTVCARLDGGDELAEIPSKVLDLALGDPAKAPAP